MMQIKDVNKNRNSIIAFALICLFLHLAIAPNFVLGLGVANFACIFAVTIAFTQGSKRAIWAGFIAGLIYDFTTTGPVGLMSFELVVACFILTREDRNRSGQSMLQMLKTFAYVALSVSVFYSLVMLAVGAAGGFIDAIFMRALPSALLTILAFVPFAYFLSIKGSNSSNFSVKQRSSKKGSAHLKMKSL